MSPPVSAMAAMIVGQRLAGWPTEKPALIHMLSRAGFLAAEICENIDDAAIEATGAPSVAPDPMLILMEEHSRQTAIFNAMAIESDADAYKTYEPLFTRLTENPPIPTTAGGAAMAIREAFKDLGSIEFNASLIWAAICFLDPTSPRSERDAIAAEIRSCFP